MFHNAILDSAETTLGAFRDLKMDSLLKAERLLSGSLQDDTQSLLQSLHEEKQRDLIRAQSVLTLFKNAHLHRFNIFLKLGFTVDENTLSDAIAAILDPRQLHGLGTRPIKAVLTSLQENGHSKTVQKVAAILPLVAQDADRIHVQREEVELHTRPDIEIIAPSFVIFIENKMRGGNETEHEHGAQTDRQAKALNEKCDRLRIPRSHGLGIFLTPEGKGAESSEFAPLSVFDLVQAIQHILTDNDHCRDSLKVFFDFFHRYV